MRKISSPGLSQLLMQLRYTPLKKRRKQLDAAEELFTIIENDKEYPFEFVCYRITGFHLKSSTYGELIKGEDLLEDLRVFIFKLSGRIARSSSELDQNVYTAEKLAKKFGVSTKTIYRWRKLGLVGEKFIFDDGKRRLGYRQSTLDKFLRKNPQLVSKAKGFTRLTDKQKHRIIIMAAKLARTTNLSRYQIINRIGSEIGRSHETVRYTLVNHDQANPDKAIFKKHVGVIKPAQATEIYKLFRQGCEVTELIKRFGRNRSSIYRIINRKRAKALLAEKIEYIASDEFLDEDAGEKILAVPAYDIRNTAHTHVEMFKSTDGSIQEYLQILKDVPALNREQEAELFRRYNYLKYLACRERTGLKPAQVSGRRLQRIEDYLAEAEQIKERIIEANLRLVVGIARKHTSTRATLLDLVSEGNISLMHAVEKFDYTRGFRFTTFASWAITKDFARKTGRDSRLDKAAAASLVDRQRGLRDEEQTDFAAIERASKSLMHVVEENLTERERYVIINRFGLVGTPIKKQTKTLVQIGEELGLSKERVRQIELIALQKLRQSLSAKEFELLTG